ncbi:MAG TPA: M56 family metallopeptidase, partial [Vicinamibacterales bacterium]|nr:M56 family metallopeptidase [Vicinamibacterales bacterium]
MLVVEALLRAWHVREAAWRLRLRLIPLAVPVLVVPLYFLAAPWRIEPWFVSRYAIFAGERWNLLAIGSIGAGDLVLVLAAGLGAALFLRDALPPLLDRARQGPSEEAGPWSAIPRDVGRIVDRQAGRLAIPPPAIQVVTSRWPVLFAQGVRAPALVISAATLDALGPEELEAALAHEIAHVRYRDPAWGYALIAVRALNFFNPAIHWAARAVVDEIERRADQATVSAGIGAATRAAAIV